MSSMNFMLGGLYLDPIEIEIINWAKYNPRADRANHSWFRMQNGFITDPKFHGLGAVRLAIVVALFAEISKNGGIASKIYTSWMADQLKINSSEIVKTIQHLADVGVIRLPSGGHTTPNDPLRTNVTNVTNVTNERTNIRASGDALHPLGLLWNELCGSLPKIKACEGKRLVNAKARWKAQGPDEWAQTIKRMANSDFCKGSSGWVANFDFFIKPQTWMKVNEGNYDNNRGIKKNAQTIKYDNLEALEEKYRGKNESDS